MRNRHGAIVGLVLVAAVCAQAGDLAFHLGAAGEFTFDTGRFSGRLVAGEKSQGVISLVDSQTGTELTKGSQQYGIFSFYRLLSPDKRWGGVIWEWPKTAKVLLDGSLRIDWPAGEDHPADIAAVLRWTAPETLELQAEIKPVQDMPKVELFIGSYFKNDARGLVYTAPPRHSTSKPELTAADVTPLTVGTYLAFPRDLKAANMVYDGRWEQGLHPVQWSISRYMAAPLAVREDAKTGTSMMLMAPPEECPVIYCSYNQDPPDGVAGHYSTYISLFGRDLEAGKNARARARLTMGKQVSPAQAIEIYERYLKEAR